MAKTERIQEGTPAEDTRRPRAWLVQIGSARDPLQAPRAYPLNEGDRVVLGRQDGPPSQDPLRIEGADRSMSGQHAALTSTPEGWQLEDLGSSNGTLVWGQARSSYVLDDGDVFETGNTFWVFRTAVLADDEVPGAGPDELLRSLHPQLVGIGDRLVKVARTRVPIMLFGATGTGKEVVARAIHQRSGRTGPFLAINTAAVQANLVASELFGVERGAHSMADRSRTGQIRSAEGGTVLLDEIGDMPLEVQVSLLRVLQENEVLPVGGDAPVRIDVRFICATHQDLPELVRQGVFRADLYARLKGTTFELPPLAERREDIGRMIGVFLERYGAPDLALSPAAYRALVFNPWPLNVRELEKAVETAVALCGGDRIELEHLPEEVQRHVPPRGQSGRGPTSDEDRQRELMRLLAAHNGNVSAVARSMGYSRMQVHRWLKQLDVNPESYRG
ncbi:MAG: sigma 54-dependent Fis family transcriptional regulator [Deltaproteobacteria bacterium]|nr:sigma 54-dependent Fis family transcriptional regulator [Deltaproteobacteria bacterium]